MAATSDNLLRRILADGADAYRKAIAAQVEGSDPSEHWQRWRDATAAALLVSWASGAISTVQAAGIPLTVPRDGQVARFDRDPFDDLVMRFRPGPAREVVRRFIRLLPMTRERWETLVARAFTAASELRDDEAANALSHILERSPDLAALVTGTARPDPLPTLPEEVRKRRTGAVQAAVQGTFFVTGMDERQIVATKDLLAKAVRGDITTSDAGKRLADLGVGDFVEQAVIETGTDLTAARLETVYRTNVNRAQSQGQLDIVRDPTVQKFVPLMQFRSTKDKRTRDSHRAMSGYVATVAEIDALGIPTPLGFNCRCSWSPVPIATALAKGWCKEDGVPDDAAIRQHNGNRRQLIDKGLVPDPGFLAG